MPSTRMERRPKVWALGLLGLMLAGLIGHPLFHRQTVNDSDHTEPPTSLIVLLVGLRAIFTRLHLYAAPLDIVVGLPARGNEKEPVAALRSVPMQNAG